MHIVLELFATFASGLVLFTMMAIPGFLFGMITGMGLWIVLAPLLNYCDPFILIFPLTIVYTIGFVAWCLQWENEMPDPTSQRSETS